MNNRPTWLQVDCFMNFRLDGCCLTTVSGQSQPARVYQGGKGNIYLIGMIMESLNSHIF